MKKQKVLFAFILVCAMVACMFVTFVFMSNTINCSECNGEIAWKYFLSMHEEPLCKDCGMEYYFGWPGDMNTLEKTVENTVRNIVLLAEFVVFMVAILLVFLSRNGEKKAKITSADWYENNEYEMKDRVVVDFDNEVSIDEKEVSKTPDSGDIFNMDDILGTGEKKKEIKDLPVKEEKEHHKEVGESDFDFDGVLLDDDNGKRVIKKMKKSDEVKKEKSPWLTQAGDL